MGYAVNIQNAGNFRPRISGLVGSLSTDATAMPTMQVTAGAGGYSDLTCDSNALFRQNDLIQVPGAGAAGANLLAFIRVLGRADTTADATKFGIRQQRPIITAVAAAPVSPYYRVWTRYRPDYVKLTHLGTGDTYEWYREMDENTAIKTAANGAKTIMSDSGIVTSAFGFHFHPSLLGVSSQMVFEVRFASAF